MAPSRTRHWKIDEAAIALVALIVASALRMTPAAAKASPSAVGTATSSKNVVIETTPRVLGAPSGSPIGSPGMPSSTSVSVRFSPDRLICSVAEPSMKTPKFSRKPKFGWIVATPQKFGSPPVLDPVSITKRAAAEPMLPSLKTLIVPEASIEKRNTLLPSALTIWPNCNVTVARISISGSPTMPALLRMIAPEISMKNTRLVGASPGPGAAPSCNWSMIRKLSLEAPPAFPERSLHDPSLKATVTSPVAKSRET